MPTAATTSTGTPLDVLRTVFGYDAFRGQQAEIIDTVVAGGDVLVLMPTGAGKSLCYQVPALVRPGTGVVVSPLIALMQDQVDALRLRCGKPLAPVHMPLGVGEEFRGVIDLLHEQAITRVEGQLADGRRIDLPLRVGVSGISRAEIEARIPQITADPALLGSVVDGWSDRHPDEPELLQVWLVQDETTLVRGRPGPTRLLELVTWVVPR